MPQVGIFGHTQESYGVSPTFDVVTLLNTGRNLKSWHNFSDFIGSWYPWDGIWYDTRSGVGTDSYPITNTEAGRIGILSLNAGTDVNGRVSTMALGLGVGGLGEWGLLFGGGEWTFETELIPSHLATAIDDFDLWAGFSDNGAAGDIVDGACFKYDRATSLNWLCITSDNSVQTIVDSGIPVAVAWTKLKIVVNAAGTAARFYIAGVLVATIVTNIPLARQTAAIQKIEKSAGALPRQLIIDWTWLHYNLSVSR